MQWGLPFLHLLIGLHYFATGQQFSNAHGSGSKYSKFSNSSNKKSNNSDDEDPNKSKNHHQTSFSFTDGGTPYSSPDTPKPVIPNERFPSSSFHRNRNYSFSWPTASGTTTEPSQIRNSQNNRGVYHFQQSLTSSPNYVRTDFDNYTKPGRVSYKSVPQQDTNFLHQQSSFLQSHNYNPSLHNLPQSHHGPVIHYMDPLRSRVDPSMPHDLAFHSQLPPEHRAGGEGTGEHGSAGGHHGETNHDHHMPTSHGWGHPEETRHHHKDKKKHKNKKGVLSKLIHKFKPHHKEEKLIWKQVPECNGYENFVFDMEILSWLTGWIGFAFATIGLVLHTLNQLYLTLSVVKIGVPERITHILELLEPVVAPIIDPIIPGFQLVNPTWRMFITVVALIDYFFNLFVSYPLGWIIVAVEAIAEVLTVISLALATFTIFNELAVEMVWGIFSLDLEELFVGYGCNNPFDKGEKVEELLAMLGENKGKKVKGLAKGFGGGGKGKGAGGGWGRRRLATYL